MALLIEAWELVRAFMESGGEVLFFIFGITFFMWTLILERLWYFRRVLPRDAEALVTAWRARTDHKSWYGKQVRRMELSRIKQKINHSIPMINTLVSLCPLLGLLGTVTGMIEVFDVMAIAGSGNPRAMASGVSRSTIPTMAGMVAALSGLYFTTRLARTADQASTHIEEQLSEG